MSYYKRHVFFCRNQREPLEACCNNHGALEMQAYAKQRTKSLRMDGKGKVRINKAGCLDRCNEGPIFVVYPDAVRYTYVDKHDVEEIIDSHVVHGRIVERLKI
jgi:(2Fe-2S) ferredoxin